MDGVGRRGYTSLTGAKLSPFVSAIVQNSCSVRVKVFICHQCHVFLCLLDCFVLLF